MSLKSFIKKIGAFFGKLFNSLKPELQKAIAAGVEITNNIKNWDDSHPGMADILTAIIPGTWDDALKERIRAKLPQTLIELRLVSDTLGLTDPNEIVKAAIATLQAIESDYDIKSATLNSLSIIAAQIAADGKLDWDDAVYLLKYYYDHKQAS